MAELSGYFSDEIASLCIDVGVQYRGLGDGQTRHTDLSRIHWAE